ncbi:MAG: hypothetical protein JWR10_637, partial [Rubritepida sp.]|nr:hypothetical protein [Rubritepida sp.]
AGNTPEPAAEAAPRRVRRAPRARPAEEQAAYGEGNLQPVAPGPAYAQTFAAAPAPTQPPALPPVATTPLFTPPPGTSFPAPVATGARRIPADNSPFTAIGTQAQPAAAPDAQQQPMPVAQPRGLPAIPVQPAAVQQRQPQADSLPPIQVTPVVASPSAGNAAAWVPSQQALPGASSALPPIAGVARPAMPSPVSTNAAPQGFFSGR